MITALLSSLALSLLMTVVLETGFFWLCGKRRKKDLLLVVLVNMLTNPIVVLLYWLAAVYTDWNLTIVTIPLELSAVLVEGYCYGRYGQGFKHPFIFSAGANVFSFGMGLLLRLLFN